MIPEYEFDKYVDRYNGNHRVRHFSCRDHIYVMSFAQLTQRDSLRDIENCLKAVSGKLYHCGIKHVVPRNTLAKANELRDWRIYADFARVLKDTISSSLKVVDEMRSIRCVEHREKATRFITPFIGDQVGICNAFGFIIPEGCAPTYMSKKKAERKRVRSLKTTDVVRLD